MDNTAIISRLASLAEDIKENACKENLLEDIAVMIMDLVMDAGEEEAIPPTEEEEEVPPSLPGLDGYVGTEAASNMLACGDATVKRLCRSGELEAFKQGQAWRISVDSIREYVGRLRQECTFSA